MKHKRIHAKITEHLEKNGDATTGQIQDWVKELRPTRKNRAKGAGFMTSQSLNVLSNVLRRKPIVKVGFDNEANQAIWGIRDSE
jgi:hypothetical protein